MFQWVTRQCGCQHWTWSDATFGVVSLLHIVFYWLCRPLLNWKQHLNPKDTLDSVSIYYLIIFSACSGVQVQAKQRCVVLFLCSLQCAVAVWMKAEQNQTFQFHMAEKWRFSDVDISFFSPPPSHHPQAPDLSSCNSVLLRPTGAFPQAAHPRRLGGQAVPVERPRHHSSAADEDRCR